jgi:hypothetical protein
VYAVQWCRPTCCPVWAGPSLRAPPCSSCLSRTTMLPPSKALCAAVQHCRSSAVPTTLSRSAPAHPSPPRARLQRVPRSRRLSSKVDSSSLWESCKHKDAYRMSTVSMYRVAVFIYLNVHAYRAVDNGGLASSSVRIDLFVDPLF